MPIDFNNYKGSNNQNSGNGGGHQPLFDGSDFFKNFNKKSGILYLVVIVAVILFLAKPFAIINSGEVGIRVTAGKFEPISLEPGIHFYIPILQKVIIVDTKVRIINYSNSEATMANYKEGIISNPTINILDSRGLPVGIDLTVQYRLLPFSAPQTIASWGLSWEDKIINPVVRDVVRSEVGKFTAEELPTKRNEIANLIENNIRAKIEKVENVPTELISIQLREIVLPPRIKEQIERVQIARQETERTRYEVEKAKQEAEREVALANGNANAMIARAKGSAESKIIEAKSDAEANKLISESLTPALLSLRQIEVQGKFNEALSVNKDAKIFLTPGGSTPNIWVDTKNTQKATISGEK